MWKSWGKRPVGERGSERPEEGRKSHRSRCTYTSVPDSQQPGPLRSLEGLAGGSGGDVDTFCQGKGTLKQESRATDLMSQGGAPKVSQEPMSSAGQQMAWQRGLA